MDPQDSLGPSIVIPPSRTPAETASVYPSNMIYSIRAAQRLDSRGKPTVRVTVRTGKGTNRRSPPTYVPSHGSPFNTV